MLKDQYASPFEIISRTADAFKQPKRVTVSSGAAESLFINQAGGYSGKWSATETPYMVEPMNALASRKHEAICFVGPARTGKTMGLLDAWMAYAVTCNPGDMLIIQMSQDKARDYSKTRIDRAIRHSPALKEKMSSRGHNDNTHDKLFNHGMWLKIGWPSATQLSSSDYRYVALTDYDRMPDNIDGEGAAFGLGLKRTQTFLSRGMCMVESSPGREETDPHWKPATPHEAPPTNGILGIYNRSDRKRWHWPCPDCFEYFEAEPGLSLFALLPEYDDLLEIARKEDLNQFAKAHAFVFCPHCGSQLEHKAKNAMNQRGLWVGEHQAIINNQVEGDGGQSNIAGYWLGGVSAAYQNWNSLILRYMQGLREYVLTGAEETLKTTINTDQGMPYMPRHLLETDAKYDVNNRAEDLTRYQVPDETRLIIASVDIQNGRKGRFVVQVHAIGLQMEQWLINRFSIDFNTIDGQKRRIDPGLYPEDFDLLIDKVICASYKTPDGRKMLTHLTVMDTGGTGNTTDNAYQFYRRIKREGLGQKLMLIKGGSQSNKDPVVRSFGKDSRGKPMKDVPLFILNTNLLKDGVDSMLRRTEANGLYLHLPDWLPEEFYSELKAEIRKPDGQWEKIRSRNEAFDLCVYILAGCYQLRLNDLRFNWNFSWCAPLESNSNVIDAKSAQIFREKKQTGFFIPG